MPRPKNSTCSPGMMLHSRWRLERILGYGGFGVVWLAQDSVKSSRHPYVAIKIQEYPKGQVDEARLLFSLQRVYSCPSELFPQPLLRFEMDGQAVLVMEHIPLSLEALIKKGSLEGRARALGALPGLVTGLHGFHLEGYIHRDIKPANILLRAQGGACLIDFGLSVDPFQEGICSGRHAAGTLSYMSLDCHKSKRACQRDDLWSIGYVMLEILCGKLPWSGHGRRKRGSSRTRTKRIEAAKRELTQSPLLDDWWGGLFGQYVQVCKEAAPFPDPEDYAKIIEILRSCHTQMLLRINV